MTYATGAGAETVGLGRTQAAAAVPALLQSLADLGVAPSSAVVLAVEAPGDMALLAATLPLHRPTAAAEANLGPAGAERLLQRIRPAIVITDRFDSDVARAARAAGIALVRPTHEPGSLRLEVPGVAGATPAAYAADVALLLQTTGTTGEPKLVGLTRGNLAASIAGIGESLDLSADDRTATIMPLTHIHGLVAVLHASLGAGGTVFPLVARNTALLWRSLDVIRPTWLSMAPTLLQDLLETAPEQRPEALSALRLLRTSSSALSLSLRRRVEAYFGVPLIEAYGMTEACHQMTSGRIGANRAGSVGLPSRGVRIAIMSADGEPRPEGEKGEVCIQGPNVTSGFLWPESANAGAFHGPWFRTGDLGRVDQDGMLWLVGRLREQIMRGGETLSPRDIEEVLLEHPDVAEAAVFPLPHPRLGEEVAALCALRREAVLDAADLRAFAAARLPFAQTPKAVFFVDALPRQAASGKVSRIAIAAAYRAAAAGEQAAPPALTPGEASWRHRLAAAFCSVLRLDAVDEHAAFFALGGTSLDGLRLVARIEAEHGVRLALTALLITPSVVSLAHAIDTGTAVRAAARPDGPGIVPETGDAIPANSAMLAAYLATHHYPHPLRNRVPMLMRLDDGLRYPEIARALGRVVAANPALHHRVEVDPNGAVALRAMTEDRWPRLDRIALAASPARFEADPAGFPAVASFIAGDPERRDTPLRAAAIATDDGCCYLLLIVNHAMVDGFSRALLPSLIEAELKGRPAPDARSFAGLMAEAYDPPPLAPAPPLPIDVATLHEDGAGPKRHHAHTAVLHLAPGLWRRIEALARDEALTPFAIAWTAFALLLEQVAGGGVPIWFPQQRRRTAADFATLGGAFTMARVMVQVTAERSFVAAVRAAMRLQFEAASDPAGDIPAHDAQSCLFEFEDEDQRLAAIHPDVRRGDAVLWSRDLPSGLPEWDLCVGLRPPDGDEAGAVRLTVDLAAFSQARAESLMAAYVGLIETVLDEPFAQPGTISVARRFDRASSWPKPLESPSKALASRPADLTSLFDAIVELWREEKALAWPGGSMTFAGLDAAARALVATLQASGARPGDIVAFRLTGAASAANRALFVCTHLAACRLGGPLLPLGQQMPAALARSELSRLDVRYVISAVPELDCAPDWAAGVPAQDVAAFPGAVLVARAAAPPPPGRGPSGGDSAAAGPVGPEPDTALLYSSSGTTGTPKTIRVSQAMLLAMLRGMLDTGVFAALAGLMGPNIGFDVALADVWLALSRGCHVVVLETEGRGRDALAEARALGARMLSLSPTVVAASVREDPGCLEGFEALVLIGEALPLATAQRLEAVAPRLRVLNCYGPAETSVCATVWSVATAGEPTVPIGLALPNYRVLIGDAAHRPLPSHWPGEILIACPVPASGYHDPLLRAARFVDLPGEAPGPFFCSGDFGWIDASGRTQFIGRRDRQVKVSGVRLEIDGVEHRIAEVAGVADVGVVLLQNAVSGQDRLAAVVQPAPDESDRAVLAARIQGHCATWLARAARPADIVFVDAMPTGPSGKKSHAMLLETLRAHADQAKMTTGGSGAVPEAASVAGRVAALWQAFFERKGIALPVLRQEDDVFDLGATSLDVLLMAARIGAAFGVRFPEEQTFLTPTIAAQAERVRALLAKPPASAPAVVTRGRTELRLVRHALAAGPARGAVIGMPDYRGGAGTAGVIAAHALQDYDIWTFVFDTGGGVIVDDLSWLACAHEITEVLLAPDALRPLAVVGYSIGGFLGWLVGRMLVAAGRQAPPVINFDGTVMHLRREGWRELVEPLLPTDPSAAPSSMLLYHRASPGRFTFDRQPATMWSRAGVDPQRLSFDTLDHFDLMTPRLIAACGETLAAFLETGRAAPVPHPIDFDTIGGVVFRLLTADMQPDASALRPIIEALPILMTDGDVLQALLLLAVASGDADLAWSYAGRIVDALPDFRAAIYAQVAMSAERERHEEAQDLADRWCAQHSWDQAMRARAQRRLPQAVPFLSATPLMIGSDDAMDSAAAFPAWS